MLSVNTDRRDTHTITKKTIKILLKSERIREMRERETKRVVRDQRLELKGEEEREGQKETEGVWVYVYVREIKRATNERKKI